MLKRKILPLFLFVNPISPSPEVLISFFNYQINILLAVNEVYLDLGVQTVEVLGQMLGGVNATMLAASASEAEH